MNKRLTEDQVREIRGCARAGMLIHDIARRFGLTIRPVRWILTRQAWAHVHDPDGAGPVPYLTKNGMRTGEGKRSSTAPATINRIRASKPPRPVCPDCGGLIESDINENDEPFLACETCRRVWPGVVTTQERSFIEQRKYQQERKRQQQELEEDQSCQMATQGMADAPG